MSTRARVALAAVAATLAVPAAADASTIVITASAGPPAGKYIDYRATRGEINRVQVLIKRHSLVLVDRGAARIRTGGTKYGRCRATSRQRAVCPRYPLSVLLRDGDDRFTAAPGANGAPPTSTSPLDYAEEPYEDTVGAVVDTVHVDAGEGDDFVSGSSSGDFIAPGPGMDRVEGRGGPDEIRVLPDGEVDRYDGGGGIDAVSFRWSIVPLTIDLAAGTGGPAGESDVLERVERVHGGKGADVLRGSDGSDALYGDGGDDDIDGRGGNDLLVGASWLPDTDGGVNKVAGGDGNDLLDARAEPLGSAHGAAAACGAGTDSFVGYADTQVSRDCELAVPRTPLNTLISRETLFPASPTKILPVAQTAASLTFEVACPSVAERKHSHCGGEVWVEQSFGEIDLRPGMRGNVTVNLGTYAQDQVAGGELVAVTLGLVLAPPDGGSGTPTRLFSGWRVDL